MKTDINLTPKIEETTIKIEGIEKDTTIIQVTDSHTTLCDERDDEYIRGYFGFDKQWFKSTWTRTDDAEAEDVLDAQIDYINNISPDITVLTGDIISSVTKIGIEYLENICKRLKKYMFIPGNHDWIDEVAPDNNDWKDGRERSEDGTLTKEARKKAKSHFKNIVSDEEFEFQVKELNGLLLIGMNTSNYLVSEHQLQQLRRQLDRGMPCLLFLHVPVYTEELVAVARKVRGVLLATGVPQEILDETKEPLKKMITPDKTSYEFMELISREDTPIKAIFSGHVHYSHQSPLKNGVMQYVTDMGINGTIRKINIVK